jgi:uncharacterized protein
LDLKVVVDTNVIASGILLGGLPGKVVEAIYNGDFHTYASAEIVEEYNETIEEILNSKKKKFVKIKPPYRGILIPLIEKLNLIEVHSKIKICRDPDDDKFIECAEDAKALYIVSGDKDLLSIRKYKNIDIVTVREFYDKYMAFRNL